MYIFERGETAEGRCKNQLRHYMIRQISSIQAYPTAGDSQTSYLVFAQCFPPSHAQTVAAN